MSLIGLEAEEVHFYHKTAGEAAFKMLDMLIRTPNKFNETFDTNEGTVYKSLRKASMKGKKLATQQLKNIYRKILTDARKMARDELFYNSEFSEALQAVSEGVRMNSKNEAEETKRAMQ